MEFSGSTTLITGASAGIGAAFAEELARRGSDLVLVARRRGRLDDAAADLTARFGRRVDVIATDLGEPAAGHRLKESTDDLGVIPTSLVNAAGFGTYGPVLTSEPDRQASMIDLNVGALADVTRAFLPGIVEHGSGSVVNVASTAGYQPVPGMAAYAASKAFVLSFTEALWSELRGTGVTALALSPGPTRTEFFDVVGTLADPGSGFQTPQQVVATALRALDRRATPPSIVSGAGSALQATTVRFLPRRAAIAIARGSVAAR